MNTALRRIFDPIKPPPFQLRHISVLFVIIIVFQVIVAFLHKTSLEKFLLSTQTWYQQDSAERLANLTSTSLELLLETRGEGSVTNERDAARLVQGLNIILSQQILNQNVKEVCILIADSGGIHAIDEGQSLYEYLYGHAGATVFADTAHSGAIALYHGMAGDIAKREEIRTVVEHRQAFHVFVPFVLRGEFVGVMYMRNNPDFSFITQGITASYDETAITFSALILFGLLAMFYLSSHTVKARDEALRLLFEKEKEHLAEHINHRKEMMFTKRIYHTHHKAEKVMGFIKEDLRTLTDDNMELVRTRVNKYANFVARVIYDMKWYDPPLQTIRSQLFHTNVNDVLRFLVDHVFQRVSSRPGHVRFTLRLDDTISPVAVNEFVVWEAFEPILQNCIEHAGVPEVSVTITTTQEPSSGITTVSIADNGVGVRADLLTTDDGGIRRIFLENVSTKTLSNQNSGYGCYIAREIAERCGWQCDVENLATGGCRFIFLIPHTRS